MTASPLSFGRSELQGLVHRFHGFIGLTGSGVLTCMGGFTLFFVMIFFFREVCGAGFRGLRALLILFCAHVAGADVLELLPGSEPPESVLVVSVEQMSEAERLAAVSLQGLAADSPTGIFLLVGPTDRLWLSLLEEAGVAVERIENLDELARRASEIHGVDTFVRTRPGEREVNVATALAGIRRAALIDATLIERAEGWGLRQVADAREFDDESAWEAGRERYAKHVVYQQSPDKWHLRDLIIASRGFVFWNASSDLLREVSCHTGVNVPLLGWGPEPEDAHIGAASAVGFRTVPADWSVNLSVLSRFHLDSLRQMRAERSGVAKEAVHCVAFVMSDGDNIQWLLGSDFARDARYWGSEVRGNFPMGWQMAPGLVDAAPLSLEWFYREARRDEFVMGVSGTGYFFPASFPVSALREQVAQIAEAIERTDMPIVTILDDAPLDSAEFRRAAARYAAIPGFEGGIYLNYADYAGGRGEGLWIGGKPFLSARFKLWDGDPVKLAGEINRQAREPSSLEGYSIVSVHPWTHTLADVQTVVDHLDADVRVVLPSELFSRVKANVRR